MARMPGFIIAVTAALLLGCGHSDHSADQLKQAMDAARQQSEQQAATDPTQQLHPNDPNPLRRKLGDVKIRELFFGPTQTQGDWIAYLPCSQRYAGMPVAQPNLLYLKRCPALQQYLLARAHAAGFSDATVANVMDTRISGAANREPKP